MPLSPKSYLYALCGLGLGIPVIAAAALLGLVRSDWYVQHSHYPYDPLVSERFGMSGQKHDVVVMGDSSALLGVIPDIMAEHLDGLSVYNLSLYAFSGDESQRLLLARYLAHNAPPKAILLHVTASHPYYDQASKGYERSLTILRYGDLDLIARYLRRNPEAIHPLLRQVAQTLALALIHPGTAYYGSEIAKLRAQAGYENNGGKKPLPPDCALDTSKDISSKGSLLALRQLAESHGVPMAIYIAPMPECEQAYGYYVAQYRGLADNEPGRLPNQDFSDHTHLLPAAAAIHSAELGSFMRKFLQDKGILQN